MTIKEYVTLSLDLDLFFIRIMKEHSLFLELAFMPKDTQYVQEAAGYRMEFERLLAEATSLANGYISSQAMDSRQFVTPYTIDAEKATSFYTGIDLDTNITRGETNLGTGDAAVPTRNTAEQVGSLNNRAFELTSQLAGFKENLLENIRACKMTTTLYPLLIEHILREARFFMHMLSSISRGDTMMRPEDMINQEVFWNRIMAEHSKFIAGLLDPSQEQLIDAARMFGKQFDTLTDQAKQAATQTMNISQVTDDSLSATLKLRDLKSAGTKGFLECKIESIIGPLLGDHVLREANHYLCVLGLCKNIKADDRQLLK